MLSRGSQELYRPSFFFFMVLENFGGVGAREAGAARERDEQEWRRQLAWDASHRQWNDSSTPPWTISVIFHTLCVVTDFNKLFVFFTPALVDINAAPLHIPCLSHVVARLSTRVLLRNLDQIGRAHV